MEYILKDERVNIMFNSKKQKKDVCPFVADPHEDCYCFDMQSISVKQAIFYCQKNYKRCEKYNEKAKQL